MTASLLLQHIRWATGIPVSNKTVRNQLHAVGLYAHRPMTCVSLTGRHPAALREDAGEHVSWKENEWTNALFNDESHFAVHPDNNPIFICMERAVLNNPAFIQESVSFGGGGVMVWDGITITDYTHLHIIRNGSVTGQRYIDVVLITVIVPCAAGIEDYFILLDDNCRPYCARLVDDFQR